MDTNTQKDTVIYVLTSYPEICSVIFAPLVKPNLFQTDFPYTSWPTLLYKQIVPGFTYSSDMTTQVIEICMVMDMAMLMYLVLEE